MVFDVSLEMQSGFKNYVSVQDDEIPRVLSLCTSSQELLQRTKQYTAANQ